MIKNQTINLALIFGGKSAEHEVSVVSAQNIARAIDRKKYSIFFVGISQDGEWLSFNEKEMFSIKKISSAKKYLNKKNIIPFTEKKIFYLKIGNKNQAIDAVFPVLHGPFGEDGTIQGLLKLYNAPFVGPGVLGSAIGMDKEISKRLLKEAGLPIAKYLTFKKTQLISFNAIKKTLGLPLFIKPANLGSSVGISKVKNQKEFALAIKHAFDFDRKIIIEEYIKGKEIECSVLGNEKPIVSIPGEIMPTHDFYSYEAKYMDENGAKMTIPANISNALMNKFKKLAIETFNSLDCEGMARVDFFLMENNKIIINEINTIPGFTSISMYPKLWEISGVSYSELIDRLIKLGIERLQRENKLKTIR